jgi:hypothetical protein
VHLIDGSSPEYSANELDTVRVIGPYSELDHVLVDETSHTPPTVVFGPEPTHDWCYTYQKADLARQRGDWASVLSIGEDALNNGLTPKDPIEWMPFLQAYALTGDIDRLTELASDIANDIYIANQVCQRVGAMQGLSAGIVETVNSLYCVN